MPGLRASDTGHKGTLRDTGHKANDSTTPFLSWETRVESIVIRYTDTEYRIQNTECICHTKYHIHHIAAVISINCLNNPLGDGVQDIIKVFEETPRLRTLCGLEEGVEHIDWSNSSKGVADVALLTADLKAGRAAAAVNSLTIDSTGNMRDRKTYTLIAGEEKINLSKKSLGSADVALVAAWLQRPEVMAAIARLVLDSNQLTGTKFQYDDRSGGVKDFDTDLHGFELLCSTMPPGVMHLSLNSCYIGPSGLVGLARMLQTSKLESLSESTGWRDYCRPCGRNGDPDCCVFPHENSC
eukprot:COSAG02_NODE_994_length_15358_cov_42.651812_12_plen_297_part_00